MSELNPFEAASILYGAFRCRQPEGDDDMSMSSGQRQVLTRSVRESQERHDNYLQALEGEVRTVRELVHLDKSVLDAEVQNQMLKDLMASHNIALPEGMKHRNSVLDQNLVQISIVGPPGPDQFLKARAPSDNPCLVDNAESTMSEARDIVDGSVNTTNGKGDQGFPAQEPSVCYNIHNETELAGFDFVFMLEQPCLGHVNHAATDTGAGNLGHALTLQAASLSFAPPSTSPGESWKIPMSEFDRLLGPSSAINLPNELSPIQLWDRVRRHPRFAELTQEGLEKLALKLRDVQICHGYGCVVEEATFDALFAETFPSGDRQ